METRDLLNAWIGHLDQKRQDYSVHFETVRFGSFYNVFSNDQAKAIKKARNPYMDKPKKSKGVDPLKIGDMLSGLAKGFNNGKT